MRARRRTHHSHVALSRSDEEFQSQTPRPAWDAAWDRVRAERKQTGLPNTYSRFCGNPCGNLGRQKGRVRRLNHSHPRDHLRDLGWHLLRNHRDRRPGEFRGEPCTCVAQAVAEITPQSQAVPEPAPPPERPSREAYLAAIRDGCGGERDRQDRLGAWNGSPGLRSVVEETLEGVLFEVEAGVRYVITDRTVRGGEPLKQSMSQPRAPLSYHLLRSFRVSKTVESSGLRRG